MYACPAGIPDRDVEEVGAAAFWRMLSWQMHLWASAVCCFASAACSTGCAGEAAQPQLLPQHAPPAAPPAATTPDSRSPVVRLVYFLPLQAFSKYGTLRNCWVARKPPGFGFGERWRSAAAGCARTGGASGT